MPMRHEHVYEQVPPSHWADTVTRFAEEHYPLLFGAGRELVSKIAKGLPELAREAFWDFRGTTEQRDIDAKCVELWASELWTAIVAVKALRKGHDRVAADIARRDIRKRLGDAWELAGTVTDRALTGSPTRRFWRVNWIAVEDVESRSAAGSVAVEAHGRPYRGEGRLHYAKSGRGSSRSISPTAIATWTGELSPSQPGVESIPDSHAAAHENPALGTEAPLWPYVAVWQIPKCSTELEPGPTFLFVAVNGTDEPVPNNQHPHGSHDHPFASIQKALTIAGPGTTVRVMPGEYIVTLQSAHVEMWVDKTSPKLGKPKRAACVFVNRSGQPGLPVTIKSDKLHAAHIRYVFNDADLEEKVIFGAYQGSVRHQWVPGAKYHAYGFLLAESTCNVVIDGFRLTCMHRGVGVLNGCRNIELRNMLIERLGTNKFGYQDFTPSTLSSHFDKVFGDPNPDANKPPKKVPTIETATPADLQTAGISSIWLNQHVGIEVHSAASYVRISQATIRHLGALAQGASGAHPSPASVGCAPGSSENCATQKWWHHAFNHSHAIYAQGFGIIVENSMFYDITQGSAIKIDGNLVPDGRPDKALGPVNEGFGKNSHKIVGNCFGPDRNPSATSPPVVMYTNSSSKVVVILPVTFNADSNKSKPSKGSTKVAVRFNAPKNVHVDDNVFVLAPGAGFGASARAPVWISQSGWLGMDGFKARRNSTGTDSLLALRLPPCKTVGGDILSKKTCSRVAPGSAPQGGWSYAASVWPGDLQHLVALGKAAGANANLIGASASQLPPPTAPYLTCQSIGDAGTFLLVNDGVVALYNTAHKLGWQLDTWPFSWPPVVDSNEYGPPLIDPLGCMKRIPRRQWDAWHPQPDEDTGCGS